MGICDSDDKNVIDIKPEPCYEICNTKVSIPHEANDSANNNKEYCMLQYGSDNQTNIKQSEGQTQNTIDKVKIKHEVGHDADIDMDYRIINTVSVNIVDVHTIKTENEKILPYTETSLNIEKTNIEPAQLKVEVDDGKDFLYDMTNNMNASNMEKNIDYENLNAEDDVNTKYVPHLQSKGKERLLGWDHLIVIYLLLISN